MSIVVELVIGLFLAFVRAVFCSGGEPTVVEDPERQRLQSQRQWPPPKQPAPHPAPQVHVQPGPSQRQQYEELLRQHQQRRYLQEQEARQERERQKRVDELVAQHRRHQEAEQQATRGLSYIEQLRQKDQHQRQPPPPPRRSEQDVVSIPPPPAVGTSSHQTWGTLAAQQQSHPPPKRAVNPRVRRTPDSSHGEQQQPRASYPQPRRPKPIRQGKHQQSTIKGKRAHHTRAPVKGKDHSEDDHYKGLRQRSSLAGEEMARCFQEAKVARQMGHRARVREATNKANAFKAEMDRLNVEARDWIFTKNNLDSAPSEFDLHGLYVKEAIQKAEECLFEAHRQGEIEARLIVGKGLHSPEQTAKVKPAIEQLMITHGLTARLDPNNSGVLIVTLSQTINNIR